MVGSSHNNTLHWPLLAESGPSYCRYWRRLNVRFPEKQTFNMNQNRLVPRWSGH